MTSGQPLVSVIVPAWNAQATLLETLRSAAAQTHRKLEILIVDDGSTDGTAEIAAKFCESDNRARLIRQANAGVAAARNRAIDESMGEWIAPLDADDLWHREKIERQLCRAAEAAPDVGLIYCWYRMIDGEGRVTEPPWAPVMEGWVFRDHLKWNFGTGSSPLIRRSALANLRYDPELQRAGNQGCEDWLLQLQIAARWKVACTRAFLLGYRARADNMSSDAARMIRSHIQMYEIIQRQFPDRERRIVERELARWRARLNSSEWNVTISGAEILALLRRLRPRRTADPSIDAPFLGLSLDAKDR
jgi:glycosyltransferase involved in cell wall biosynthesis